MFFVLAKRKAALAGQLAWGLLVLGDVAAATAWSAFGGREAVFV